MNEEEVNDIKWPYPVRYDKTKEHETDVLILGGGTAGCLAAISAVKKGAKVIVVDKASVSRSGSGGMGVDHWHGACTNPACKISPEEMLELNIVSEYGFTFESGLAPAAYVCFKEGYDTLLEMEKMGLQIRDKDDIFKGAEFRDEETKLLFAYDYDTKHCVKFMGAPSKPVMYKELDRLGVEIYSHIMVTSLLNDEGQQGNGIVGATGLNVRTGEFNIFESKATVLAMGYPNGSLWASHTELNGFASIHMDPNCVGDGHAMAWKAGAEFSMMEYSLPSEAVNGYNDWPKYGTGNAGNTWYACSIVDSKGKEVPWIDRDGRELTSISERYRLSPGQKMMAHPNNSYDIQAPILIPDLPDRIKRGQFVPPFYADLPGMPEIERRSIWGLMVGNEGKTRIPVYDLYNKAGFDPDKDMLEVNMVPIEEYGRNHFCFWGGVPHPTWREFGFAGGGGPVYNWDLRTSLEGLYAAGGQLLFGGNYSASATTGRYAGRKAAEYALRTDKKGIDHTQIELEKKRIYAPVMRENGTGWKEVWAGIARIMQDYCGEYRNEEILKKGLLWLKEIRENEAENACARNPHELWRTLENMVRITTGEMIMHASMARKASSRDLNFNRIDYPEMDTPGWKKFVTTRLEGEDVKVDEIPLEYWLKSPNASAYEENYLSHCGA